MTLLRVENIAKVYRSRVGKNNKVALKDIHFSVEQGEYVAIMGESGSGKSTLLNILATLDKPTEGQILLKNKNLDEISDKDSALFRRKHLGFVFQDFNLLNNFSVKDNIALPLVLSKYSLDSMETAVANIAENLGIETLLDRYPYELSGGQQQRVATARALVTQPDLVLADEPTGALDSKSAQTLLHLFQKMNQTQQTIIMVTHSAVAASHAKRILFLKDGQIYHQLYRGNQDNEAFLSAITDVIRLLLTEGGN